MITKDQFISFINSWEQHAKEERLYGEVLDLDSDFLNWACLVADLVITTNFSIDAADIVFWYIYERHINLDAYPVHTVEDLWEAVIKQTNEDFNN